MKASVFKTHRYFFGVCFSMGCLFTLFAYQNCSREVSFDSRPSVDRPDITNPNGTNGTQTVGGNSNVVIRLNDAPQDTTVNNGNSQVDYEVTSPNSPIANVVCELDGQPIACQPVDQIPITNPALGEHTFLITGTNNNGETATEVIRWVVYNEIIAIDKDIAVNVTGDKVDILINVDNSGSMEYEQQSMAGRISNLINQFQHLDYNIAVTTTSPIGGVWNSGLNYVDGKFIPLGDGHFCVKKTVHSAAQAQSYIQGAVVRDLYLRDSSGNVVNDSNGNPFPEGNGWERGIFTTYRAFERSAIGGTPEAGCFRSNVPKHVILISDERETLNDTTGNDLPSIAKSSGTNLRALASNLFGANTVFKFHSIIVNPYSSEGETCLAGHGAKVGLEYGQLSQDTGGYIGSVCAADYASQLGAIGETISDSAQSYPLECIAVANNGDIGSVTNLSTGNPIDIGFGFNGDKVEFDQLLPAGNYRVRHYCYQ